MILTKKIYGLCFLVTLSSVGYADENNTQQSQQDNFQIIFDTKISYGDNLTQSRDNKVSSGELSVSPGLVWNQSHGHYSFGAKVGASKGEYFNSKIDNYLDLNATLFVKNQLNIRNQIKTQFSWKDIHESRGSGYSTGIGNTLAEPDQYSDKTISIDYIYGASTAKGQIHLSGLFEKINYQPRLTFNDSGQVEISDPIIDREQSQFTTAFTYKHSKITVIDVSYERLIIDYAKLTSSLVSLDSREDVLLLGFDWQPRESFQLKSKLGVIKKTFDADLQDSFLSEYWQIDTLWKFKKHSSLSFESARKFEETYSFGNFVNSTSHNLSWLHQWSSLLNVKLSFATYKQEFIPLNEIDKMKVISALLNYQLSKRMDFEFGFTHETKDSSVSSSFFNYDQNEMFLSLKAVF